jgi:S-(hydroxymethyl)glutathione dehydrogenase / alcohol dehydrogenase
MIRSRSLVLRAPGVAPAVEVVDVLDPGPGEVRVRMVASGICATDAHAVSGEQPILRWPVVLGHEGAGVVDLVGDGVTDLAVGDHVVIAVWSPCGECRLCRRGRLEDCDSDWRRSGFAGVQPDGHSRIRQGEAELYPMFGTGTLAEYTTIRAAQAIKVDDDLPLEALCLTGCSVATGVGAVVNIAHVQPGDSVLVVGCGGVGLNVVQGAAVAGATTIIAADLNPDKLDLARSFGATHVIDTRQAPLEVRSIVPEGVDAAFEVVGNPQLVIDCLAQTRPGGACVLVGLSAPGVLIPLDGRALTGGRRLLGCPGGGGVPRDNIERFVALYGDGRIKLDELVGQTLSLAETDVGFRALEVGTVARSVVLFPWLNAP